MAAVDAGLQSNAVRGGGGDDSCWQLHSPVEQKNNNLDDIAVVAVQLKKQLQKKENTIDLKLNAKAHVVHWQKN
jgi:hypothetical protein